MKIILDISYEELVGNPKLIQAILRRDNGGILKSVQIPNNIAYYNSDNVIITERKKYYWDYENGVSCEDYSKANNRIPHGYHKEIVDQATNYLVGKRFDVLYDEEITDEVALLLDGVMFKDNELHIKTSEYLGEMQLKHYGWWYVFQDEDGSFRFEKIDTEELTAIYDTTIDNNITAMIREYSEMQYNDKTDDFEYITYVAVYSNKEVTIFTLNKSGKLEEVEKKPLLSKEIEFVDGTTEITGTGEWHGVPFIPIEFDEYEKTQLDFYKDFIDMIDIDISDLANNIQDIQEVIWVLENYAGQDLRDFMEDLRQNKSIKVGAGGSVDALKNEIPTDARKELFQTLQKSIYKFGQGVDLDVASISNVAQETLTIMFSRLDLKCDNFEIRLTKSIRELYNFLSDYLYYATGVEIDLSEVEITFNRDIIINESSRIENLVKSTNILSEKTILSNHPYVKDVNMEMELLDAESEGEELLVEVPEEEVEEIEEEIDGDEDTEEDGTDNGE